MITEIAPFVRSYDTEGPEKRFDNFIYGMILAKIEETPRFNYAKKQLCEVASALEKKANIPQVKEKMTLIREMNTDEFWETGHILMYETIRKELRRLMKILFETMEEKKTVVTRLLDTVVDEQEGIQLESEFDFEDYRRKVNRYVEEHKESIAIHKLTHNEKLSKGDYKELEWVLTEELDSREDYQREFGDTPFGLLIRQIAKLDHDAVMAAFSAYVNDESQNQKQIQFIYKIINHIEQNGYLEKIMDLQKPPFDKPIPFIKMFDAKLRNSLLQTIHTIEDNARCSTA